MNRHTRSRAAGIERVLVRSGRAVGVRLIDGETIEHHIDGSWNQVWTGTTQIRNVKKDGDRLIYTTQPGPSPIDNWLNDMAA